MTCCWHWKGIIVLNRLKIINISTKKSLQLVVLFYYCNKDMKAMQKFVLKNCTNYNEKQANFISRKLTGQRTEEDETWLWRARDTSSAITQLVFVCALNF